MNEEQFNIGDNVFIEYDSGELSYTTIIGITAAGKFKVKWGDSSLLFYPNGRQCGGNSWHFKYLRHVTAELVKQYEQQVIRRVLEDTNFSQLSDETQKQIYFLIKKDKNCDEG